MELDDLLTLMERVGIDTFDTSCHPLEVSAKPAPIRACTSDTSDTKKNNVVGDDRKKVEAYNPTIPSYWWRIYYSDHRLEEVACCPPVTKAEILEWRPDAIAAEPFANSFG